MPRYINADRLIFILATDCQDASDAFKRFESDEKASAYWQAYATGLRDAVARVWEEPAADVRENVHTHWVKELEDRGMLQATYHYRCPICNTIVYKPAVRFCPMCGAVMDGVDK